MSVSGKFQVLSSAYLLVSACVCVCLCVCCNRKITVGVE